MKNCLVSKIFWNLREISFSVIHKMMKLIIFRSKQSWKHYWIFQIDNNISWINIFKKIPLNQYTWRPGPDFAIGLKENRAIWTVECQYQRSETNEWNTITLNEKGTEVRKHINCEISTNFHQWFAINWLIPNYVQLNKLILSIFQPQE